MSTFITALIQNIMIIMNNSVDPASKTNHKIPDNIPQCKIPQTDNLQRIPETQKAPEKWTNSRRMHAKGRVT